MENQASRTGTAGQQNFLLPELDFIGRYRWRGFGDDLLDANREGRAPFDNAYQDLTTGDFQEWQAGLELSVPLGFRHGHTAVRNAELRLIRERSVLRAAERDVLHGLSTALADMDRSLVVTQTSYSRVQAARNELQALRSRVSAEGESLDSNLLDLLLDAQRRLSDAETGYYQAQVEYMLAVKNVHLEKGSLLEYCGVALNEGAWPGKAYRDAARLEQRRGKVLPINYSFSDRRIAKCPRCVSTPCQCAAIEGEHLPVELVPVPDDSQPTTPSDSVTPPGPFVDELKRDSTSSSSPSENFPKPMPLPPVDAAT